MAQSPFLKKTERFIAANKLLNRQDRYLVGLSGGADSVALLRVLRALGYTVEAVHCNFHLRGAESDRDERFCIALCRTMVVVLHRVHFDTRAHARLHRVSIEMAARELRYNYFFQLCRDLQMNGVCVAHHSDDNVETVLMNLVRGTGVSGLTGIAPRNGLVLRPLLGVSRHDIEQFLEELGQGYVTDSTNLVADVVRNKVRLNLIPLLQELNPSVTDSILRMADHLTEAEKILDQVVSPFKTILENGEGIPLSMVFDSPSPAYLLFRLLSPYGFTPAQIRQMAARPDLPTGKVWHSKTHELLADRGRLWLQPNAAAEHQPLKIPETGLYVYDDTTRLKVSKGEVCEGFTISKENHRISLDASGISFPLLLRPCKTGDRFVPFGMHGSKLVSDYLTDCKKTLFEKRNQLLLVNANNDILWLVGERTDNRYRVTDSTKAIFNFELIQD